MLVGTRFLQRAASSASRSGRSSFGIPGQLSKNIEKANAQFKIDGTEPDMKEILKDASLGDLLKEANILNDPILEQMQNKLLKKIEETERELQEKEPPSINFEFFKKYSKHPDVISAIEKSYNKVVADIKKEMEELENEEEETEVNPILEECSDELASLLEEIDTRRNNRAAYLEEQIAKLDQFLDDLETVEADPKIFPKTAKVVVDEYLAERVVIEHH